HHGVRGADHAESGVRPRPGHALGDRRVVRRTGGGRRGLPGGGDRPGLLPGDAGGAPPAGGPGRGAPRRFGPPRPPPPARLRRCVRGRSASRCTSGWGSATSASTAPTPPRRAEHTPRQGAKAPAYTPFPVGRLASRLSFKTYNTIQGASAFKAPATGRRPRVE